MDHVVITGGSGLVGRYVIKELTAYGYQVTNVDRQPPPQALRKLANFQKAELTDVGQVYKALREAKAVVHLAAIPSPQGLDPHVVFTNNVNACYHLLEAARVLRIKKIVIASSVNVIGLTYNRELIKPDYLPIDERHPCRPEDCYSLSKYLSEKMAEAFARLSPETTLVSLRLHGVVQPSVYKMWQKRPATDPWQGAKDLWGYVDVRDVAAACRLALIAPFTGHQAFFITAADTSSSISTETLIKSCFPLVPVKKRLKGFQSLFDCNLAENLLGWKAKYSWRM